MTLLRNAIMAAGAELGGVHGWTFGSIDSKGAPTPDDVFVTVLERYLTPLSAENSAMFKAARIAALRAELAAIEPK